MNTLTLTSSGVFPEILEKIDQPYAEGIGETGMLVTAVLPDGIHEILLRDFTVAWKNHVLFIPRGFVTDYASVPRFFQRLIPQRGKYSPAAVIHDFLYWTGIYSRAESDKIAFLELSRRLGVGFLDRVILYLGVRIGGWVAWRMYRKSKKVSAY